MTKHPARSSHPSSRIRRRRRADWAGKGEGLILLGVTGGIASGKTTVSRMLQELGVPAIDFDWLSRVVVEPGQPAWKDIVSYFGEEVLQPDRTLDRKKLGAIVFRDPRKRAKLEKFTHPRIHEEFISQVRRYASGPRPIAVQAVVPLLFEANLGSLFDRVLVVYVPREMQIERLMRRDGISREMALRILEAQLPIEQKREWGDFVIDNSGTLEETRRQVEEVRGKLPAIHQGRSAGR